MTDVLARERRMLILESARRRGAVRVGELTDRFEVSAVTIRRDLDALACAGVMKKVHGGAVAVSAPGFDETGFEARTGRQDETKRAIAKAAATLVEPGTAVAISAGTTALAVAKELLNVPRLTVLTNSLPVADLLRAEREKKGARAPELLLTGGSPTPSCALAGPVAERTIRALHVDLLILGAHGVSARAGLTTPDLAEAQTNRALIAAARQVAVVADHSKWEIAGLARFADLGDIHCFVTDSKLPGTAQAILRKRVASLKLVTVRGR
ncbi:DeoR/GlpR family DNA-binding transcription regulator [Kitasatospora sp. NPDC008050]|uniref:DeoR/GlpR family DNA-binding transcription regulator n=1 Tax=Kitasatospora sp. NPDC008050 TaxID=3364021 RepID=UPI0036EC26AD